MSIKIQCDKCGTLMKPDFYITKIETHEFIENQWYERKFDLCKKCTEELLKWVNKID